MNNIICNESSIHWAAAEKATQAAVRKAIDLGVMINVAVVDRGGNLLAFQRINGAALHSISIAQDKAYTSVSFRLPTSDWKQVLADLPFLREGLAQRDRLVMFGGGLPIEMDGELIGGIGVSGASEEQDEACAKAGLQALNLS